MSFIATIPAAQDAFTRLRQQAVASKTYLTNQRAAMVSATVSADIPVSVIQHLGQVITILDTLASTPGLPAYAKAQVNDSNYDIASEYTGMRTAMVSARDNLIAGFPKDGNGFLLYQTLSAAGAVQYRTFTAAQLASAVALIDAVIATIS